MSWSDSEEPPPVCLRYQQSIKYPFFHSNCTGRKRIWNVAWNFWSFFFYCSDCGRRSSFVFFWLFLFVSSRCICDLLLGIIPLLCYNVASCVSKRLWRNAGKIRKSSGRLRASIWASVTASVAATDAATDAGELGPQTASTFADRQLPMTALLLIHFYLFSRLWL